ncbi:MAG: hypothetical protein ACYDCC_03285 [Actinomycetota bacterium]
MSSLISDLESLGFRRIGARRSEEWVKQATQYLTYSLHPIDEHEILFTWELAIGELMRDRGFMVGTNDPLQVFLYPQSDSKGPATIEFVTSEIKRTQLSLKELDFLS